MTKSLRVSAAVLMAMVVVGRPVQAQQHTISEPIIATSNEAEARYTATIEKRAQDILVLLDLKDAGVSNRVHDAIIAHYRGLRSWQDTNEARLKTLNKQSGANKQQIAQIEASREKLHDQFVSKLSADLTPEQVEKVEDKMTYNKVEVTYNGYCDMLPGLTSKQKAKILEWLKEAREKALVGVSAEEKTAVFNKYKGRINNYLSKEGYDLAKASKEWNEKLKARRSGNGTAPR